MTLRQPEENQDFELPDTDARILLSFLGALMIVAGVSLMTKQLADAHAMRPGPVFVTLGGFVMLWLVHRRKFTQAIWTLCLSVIAAIAGGAFVLRGLHNMGWIAVPIVVLTGAWVLGRRAANILMALSITIVGIFYWLHYSGHGFVETPSPQSAAVILVTAIIAAAIVGRVISLRIQTTLQKIRESKAELAAIFDSASDLIWSVEPEHFTLRSFNEACRRFFEESTRRTLAIGENPSLVFPENELARDWNDMHRKAIESDGYTMDWACPDKGTQLELRFNIMRRGDIVFGISVFAKDVTSQRRAQRQVEFLAYRDTLTRLPNRVLGIDRLQHSVRLAERHSLRLGVLFLDLNDFKRINETHGHAFGDEVLKAVALRLQTQLRGQDTLCRLSGNVFMLILPDLSIHGHLTNVCERILEGLSSPLQIQGNQLVCSASLGIAVYPGDGNDSESLMRNAEIALNEAKKLGHGTMLFFEQEMNERVARYVQIRDDMRAGLERGEFELHYQPQWDMAENRVIGFEALLRWNHPREGMMNPAEFVGIAEETGLIVPIGAWVLQTACEQGAALNRAGWPDLFMAVNLSAVQFRLGDIRRDVESALSLSGLNPARLELELTESSLIQSADAFAEFTSEWKKEGIRVAIDDFGTGYSSMAYLRRLNIDKFKIDRSFVANIDKDAEDRAVVKAMIQIARSLHLDVTAEGVETEAIARLLVQLGCHQVQGYLFSRPLPANALTDWLRKIA